MKKRLAIFSILITAIAWPAKSSHDTLPAREVLSIDQLAERLLEVNYSIEISRLAKEQAANNVTNAQFLPTLTGTAGQNQNTKGAIGTVASNLDRWNTTNTIGAGVLLGWTIFDGLGMFAQHDRQKKLLSVSDLNLRYDIESAVSELANGYSLVVSLVNRVAVARESMKLSQIRYNEALLKYDIGTGSGLEAKLARTDLNTDSSQLIQQIEALDVAYIELNSALNLDYDTREYIKDTIILREKISKEKLQEHLLANNTDLLLARGGVEIADIDVRLARASKYPKLDFGGSYNYNATDADNFRGTFANSNGFNWGFNMSVNIFEGLEAKRKLTNAKIDRTISAVNEKNIENSVLSAFNSLYTNYSNNLQMIDFETQNAEASRQNLEVAMERYRLGEMSGIDFRTIQQQYLSVVDRKLSAIYQAKASEIALLRLAGKITEVVYGPNGN